MAEDTASSGVISATIPDRNVRAEKVQTQSAHKRKQRRAGLFLKGPIPLPWIRQHVQCPPDRLLLVLRAHGDMQRTNEFKLTAGILRDAGIDDRKAGYRALGRLEANGSLTVNRKRGRRPIVRLVNPSVSRASPTTQ